MAQPPQIENIPPEIWTEVFLHAQKRYGIEATRDQAMFKRSDVPISVSQVSNRFRTIATSTPHLWSTIVVDFASMEPSSMLSLTKLWLDRSKESPLSFFIWNVFIPGLMDHQDQQDCFAAFMSHIARWKHVAIEWGSEYSKFWSSMEIVPQAPLLESLVLRPSIHEDIMEDGVLPFMIWTDSPRLQKLVVHLKVILKERSKYVDPEKYLPWPTCYTIPYHQLTHVSLSGSDHEIISRKEMYSIFEIATNLVCCFIQWISGPEPERINGSHPPPVLLVHLRHLLLEPSDKQYPWILTSELLNYITAPSLLSLTLANQSDWFLEPYERFFERSNCALEELNLIDVGVDVDDIHDCMALTSRSLRRIHIQKSLRRPSSFAASNSMSVAEVLKEYEWFNTSMTEWDATTCEYALCPHLESISLWPPNGPPLIDLLAQVVMSRMQPPGGSKTFKSLSLPSNLHDQLPQQLQELLDDPFNLKILSNDEMFERSRDTLWERLSNI